jgi:hypothetical protein
MPEGAQFSDGEEPDSRPNDDPHKALDINLDEYVLQMFTQHWIEQFQLHTYCLAGIGKNACYHFAQSNSSCAIIHWST